MEISSSFASDLAGIFFPEDTIELDTPILDQFLSFAARGKLAEMQTIYFINETILTQTDEGGETALHKAASEGHHRIVKWLLEQGVRTNLRDNQGRTPLDCALLEQQVEVIKTFIRLKPEIIKFYFPLDQWQKAVASQEAVAFICIEQEKITARQKSGEDKLESLCLKLLKEDESSLRLEKTAGAFIKKNEGQLDYKVEREASLTAVRLDRAVTYAYQQQVEERSKYPKYILSPGDSSYDTENLELCIEGEKSVKRSVTYTTSSSLEGVHIAFCRGKEACYEGNHIATTFCAQFGGKSVSIELTGVFDGHRGVEWSSFATKKIVEYLKDYLELFNEREATDSGIWSALKIACVELNQCHLEGNSYTMANLCLRMKDTLWLANIGDTRAILIGEEKVPLRLTEEQKAGLSYYKKGIRKRGGKVKKVNRKFSVPRVLGTHHFKGMSARPKITKYILEEEKRYQLVQVSRGVTKVMSTDHIGFFVSRRLEFEEPLAEVTKNLAAAAIQSFGSTDSVTVLIREVVGV